MKKKMLYYRKENLKYYIIWALCFIIVILSFLQYVQGKKKNSKVTRAYTTIDHYPYYDKETPPFKIELKNLSINFPYNKNIILVVINREVNETIEMYDKMLKKLILSEYDLEVIILTNKKGFKNSKYLRTYYYKNNEFDKYFQIEEYSKFVVLIDRNNRIKHYMNSMIPPHDLRLLIERFKIDEKKNQ